MKPLRMRRQSALAAALALALPSAQAVPGVESGVLPFPIVSLHTLARQRGGFVGAEGLRLQLDLNIRQLVMVNNIVVSEIGATLAQIADGLATDMSVMAERLRSDREALRNDLNRLHDSITTTTDGRSSNDSGVQSVRTDSVPQVDAPAPVVTTFAVQESAPGVAESAPKQVILVQNGPNNHVDAGALRDFRGGVMTVIQNSLNNQSISHVMQVDMTLSGLRNLRTMEFLGGLNLQLRAAGK